MHTQDLIAQPIQRPARFHATDVEEHLDMLVIGQTCLGVSLQGYCRLLGNVFAQRSGTLQALLTALHSGNPESIRTHAHSFKGETISLGLKKLAQLASELESGADEFGPEECQNAAENLRQDWAKAQALCHRMGFAS